MPEAGARLSTVLGEENDADYSPHDEAEYAACKAAVEDNNVNPFYFIFILLGLLFVSFSGLVVYLITHSGR